MRPKKWLGKADAARVGVVEIEIGLEKFPEIASRDVSLSRRREAIGRTRARPLKRSGVLRPHRCVAGIGVRRPLADGGAEIAAVAHQEQRRDG